MVFANLCAKGLPNTWTSCPPCRRQEITITYDSLQDRIANSNDEVRVLEGAIDELREIADVFKNSDIELTTIKGVRTKLENFFSGRKSLDQNDIARNLLGAKFAGHRTNASHFKDVAAWARATGSHGALVRTALSRGNPQDAAQHVAAVLASELALKTTLSRLANVAKIDSAIFVQGKSLNDAATELQIASEDGDGLFVYATFATAI